MLLASCTEPFAGKYKVGQHVEILTGDKFTIMEAYPGYKRGDKIESEPRYYLMVKAGWTINWDHGIRASRGIMYAYESQIIGEVPK